MAKEHILALDQGTSSSRAIVFHASGRIVAQAQRELTQHYPQPAWVEHDAEEIWRSQWGVAQEALAASGLSAADIACIGITNQRETTVLWERASGRPVHRAIVWQDRRTEPLCAQLRQQEGVPERVRRATGLVIDPYFSGTKLRWLLDHVSGAHIAAAKGQLAFGTVDSWLLYKLTEGRVHATDASNAARTMLFDIRHNAWDHELTKLLHIPDSVLPRVFPSSHLWGETTLFGAPIPIAGMAGDQQAALFGQGCFQAGQAKNTYGTGCFMLMHTGTHMPTSRHGLITTAAAQVGRQAEYALEGSVFVGGAVVQWLRDGLGAIRSSGEVQALAASVPDSGGVVVVPAFAGLGAPYWDSQARGAIVGLSQGSTMAHIARAAVESMAFQSTVLLQAMAADAVASGGVAPTELRVDGGASVNDTLMQCQADLLGLPLWRPHQTETTAAGAADLAALGVGLFPNPQALAGRPQPVPARCFEPQISRDQAAQRMGTWERAVRQARAL